MMELEAAQVLGMPVPDGRSSLWILEEVNNGLPLSALDRLVDKIAPDDRSFVFRIVSKATLARRRHALSSISQKQKVSARRKLHSRAKMAGEGAAGGSALSPEESAKVARLAEVWALARNTWGSDEAARAFLFRPHPLLDGKRPVDVVLSNEFGRPLVEGILGRLQFGSAA